MNGGVPPRIHHNTPDFRKLKRKTVLTRRLDEKVLKQLIDAQPTREMGKLEDIANVVSFLASESTLFITRQTIYVDGGKSIGAGF